MMTQAETQMRKGMLVYCVLLLCKDGKVYSSEIIRELRAAELIVVEGTLYPLLNRLARDKLLGYEWQESEQGPPRKYYWLTDEGHKLLDGLEATYNRLHKTISKLASHQPSPDDLRSVSARPAAPTDTLRTPGSNGYRSLAVRSVETTGHHRDEPNIRPAKTNGTPKKGKT